MAKAVVKPRRKPPVRVSNREIINAVEACEGDYRKAAKKLCISYGTLLARAKKCPDIYEAKLDCIGDMMDCKEDMIRMSIRNFYEGVMRGNLTASKFVLERLARDTWGNQPPQGPGDQWPDPIGDKHGP